MMFFQKKIHTFKAILSIVGLITLMNCRGIDNRVGPCVHTYNEPVLNIDRVVDSQTGAPIQKVKISSLTVDNVEQNPAWVIAGVAKNITIQDSSLFGQPPFGFGTNDGIYQFFIQATGYRDTLVCQLANYQTFKGGCPSFNDDGTHITVKMRPE